LRLSKPVNLQALDGRSQMGSGSPRQSSASAHVSRRWLTLAGHLPKNSAMGRRETHDGGNFPEGSTEFTPMLECCLQGSIPNRWSTSQCACSLIDVPERVGNALNTVLCCRKDSRLMAETGGGGIDRFSRIGQRCSGMEGAKSHEEERDRNAGRRSRASAEMRSNLQGNFFALKVRRDSSQPSVDVRSFREITRWACGAPCCSAFLPHVSKSRKSCSIFGSFTN